VTLAAAGGSPVLMMRRREGACAASEPELANARLVEAQVVTDLVTHGLGDVFAQAVGIVPEVAHERIAEDQNLVGQATAPEVSATTAPGADVQSRGMSDCLCALAKSKAYTVGSRSAGA